MRCKRAILSLVLFKPFRLLEDLIGSSTSSNDQWLDSYTEWHPTRSDFVKLIMHHIDDYYGGAERAKAQADLMQQQTSVAANSRGMDGNNDSDDSSDDCDSLFSVGDFGEDDDEDAKRQNGGACDDLIDPWHFQENNVDIVPDTQILNPVQCPTSAIPDTRTSRILQVFEQRGMLDTSASITVRKQQSTTPQEQFPPILTMRKWVQDTGTDTKFLEAPIENLSAIDTHVTELLDEALLEDAMMWKPIAISSVISGGVHTQFASIASISQAYTLNERQHCAFKRIGKALLTRWQRAEDMSYSAHDGDDALRRDQLRLFLGGEGGTGKSRVIGAVQPLCESWNRSDCLVKTALTGKAATMINGRTLASFLLQIRNKRRLPTAIYLDILVIDEISMMQKTQLVQLDKLLRAAKRVSNVPFGGVHVVLVGDFLQLPPVGGDPLYKDPSGSRRQSANELAGFELWREFHDVIILEDSVRFHADPEWGRGCRFARQGIWLPEFVALINSRIITETSSLEEWHSIRSVPTFVTPDNATRLAINNLFISTTAKLMPRGEYPVRLVANFKGKLTKLGASEVKRVMTLPDSKFGRTAPYLNLIVGMPIQITQNVRAEKSAGNGTLGTLETIIYHPDTKFCVVFDSVADITVKIPSLSPSALIVRIRRGLVALSMQGCTDSDLFPLFADACAYNQSEIRLAPSRSGMPRSLSVRIEQFPMICAISSTVYKVQGETLDNMVVTEWRSESRVANKREQPYLLVSRVTSRDAFATLCPLTGDIIHWARPSNEALNEENRLRELSEQTLQRLL